MRLNCWLGLLLLWGMQFPSLGYAYKITSYLEMVKVSAVGYAWKNVSLENSYSTPVIACTYNLPSAASDEAVVRIQTYGGAFQVKIQRPIDAATVSASDVYCMVSESGSYTYPIKYEAHRVTSTGTNSGGNWNVSEMENVSAFPHKVQSYSSPVVFGQVMSYSNANFTAFWSSNCTSRTTSATDSSVCVGKHTGQSSPASVITETLGYFIAEEGEYIQASSYVSIKLGADIVKGVGNNPPYSYALDRAYSYGVATQSAMDGGNGSWAVLYGNSPLGTRINLAADEETVAGDTSRSHSNEQVAYWVMEPITRNYAELIINEILYQQTAGLNEFIEFYAIKSGSILNYVVSSQDGISQNYRLPDVQVNAGDYVVLHAATGTNQSVAGVHHVYTQSGTTPLNNSGDDVVLLKPSDTDATTLNGSGFVNAIPVDYVAYGSGEDPVPVSENGVTVSWNSVDNARLSGAISGQSISLTPNARDSDTSVCWEKTQSGDGASCPSYLVATDSDPSAFINSRGTDNNTAPKILLSKSVATIYDPYNGASNPKAIPGSVLEYTITASNDGPLAADNNSIRLTDVIPANTKLCVSSVGYCLPPSFADGSPTSALSLSAIQYSDNSGNSYAYSTVADVEGADAAVTNLEFQTSGAFAANTTGTAPVFSVKFRIMIE